MNVSEKNKKTMAGVVKASDCKCCCGAKAVAFWPCIDPDIPSQPYCRKCLDRTKAAVIRDLLNIEH